MTHKLRTRLRNIKFRIKGSLLRFYLVACGCKIGKGLKCKEWPIFRTLPHNNIFMGDNVNIGYRITFDVKKHGELRIGNNVNFTQDIVVSTISNVTIGDDTLIAEFVSIRDGGHSFKKSTSINKQDIIYSPINIGEDVWVGAGSRLLKGSNIKKGCILAANCVMLEKIETEEFSIYAGSPARIISKRI